MLVVFLQVQPCLGEWNIAENQPMTEEVINNVWRRFQFMFALKYHNNEQLTNQQQKLKILFTIL